MEKTITENLKHAIRDVPDYPKKGIIFKDITTLLKDGQLLQESVDQLAEEIREIPIDAIAAIESRGFIFGAALAFKLKKSFIPIRKPGKLPASVISEEYTLEYGKDCLEIHSDALEEGMNVLIVDDLLATGGTAEAACRLVERCSATVSGVLFLVELSFLKGRKLLSGRNVISLITFN
jgi:adenine phosphoribosyltransferase